MANSFTFCWLVSYEKSSNSYILYHTFPPQCIVPHGTNSHRRSCSPLADPCIHKKNNLLRKQFNAWTWLVGGKKLYQMQG